ncbi:MAG: zinc ribbon domain-containing protein [Campylobacterales bacterium]|nr:zinc ribbon domain-containing protein [Campylobacterales bacterium]NQY19962.1 hypothetical protein [Campylobacteraceae bacterium]NQY53026.1 hypothetical protein [Campylobacteraceae bacterium]
MNKYLEELVKLSKFDAKISAFDPRIESENEKLAAYVNVAEEVKGNINTLETEIEDITSKISKNNMHLAELKTKLEDISKKHSAVKTEKELKALQLEEEISKEQITFANEEIIRFDAIVTTKEEQLKEFQVRLTEEETNVKELKILVDTNIENISVERNEVYEDRSKLLEKFDNKILTFYQKIKRWAVDTAVVPVKKQACYGCFMKINDKVYNEVIKSDEIVNCPHCGRILYKEVEEA